MSAATASTVTVSEPKVEISISNILASKKHNSASKQAMPSNFVVSAKIDEETRKEGQLVLSFSITLNDQVNMVIYEFRGSCGIKGTSHDFDHLMKMREGTGESRVPKILDILYQRMYSLVFILAGMTNATYPQSTALSEEAVQARQVTPQQQEMPQVDAMDAQKDAAKTAPSSTPSATDVAGATPIPKAKDSDKKKTPIGA